MRHTVQGRFDAKYIEDVHGCWLWTASLNYAGYGKFGIGYVTWRAHRASYMLHVGEIPKGLEVHHLCSVRHCVNPAHLELVTRRENNRFSTSPSAINARKTHCPRGHEYSHVAANGGRRCHVCDNKHSLERYYRRREAREQGSEDEV